MLIPDFNRHTLRFYSTHFFPIPADVRIVNVINLLVAMTNLTQTLTISWASEQGV